MMDSLRRSALLLFLPAVLASVTASSAAQEVTGTIRGTVTDRSGARVPNATVILLDANKSIEVRRLASNSSGEYVAPLLPVGTYEIDVDAPGFKRFTERGVTVNVSDRLEANVTLDVGQSDQRVEVNASQLSVQTDNAAAESLISGQQVRALPTNNRNYEQLVAIQPGVSGNVPDQLFVGVYNYKNQTNVAAFSIGGGRDTQNNWTIDGADNVDRGSNRTLLNYPSVDAIEEFKLLRGTYNAEYGRGAAGQVEVVTRSGGKQFHGGVYEFFRNDAMDANSFTNKLAGLRRTALRYNDFGGTIGGPLWIPGLYHPAKQRTTFFFSEEIRRIKTPTPLNAEVPTAAMRNGVFPFPVCTATDSAGNCTASSSTITPVAAASGYLKDIYSKVPTPQGGGGDPFSLISSPTAQFNYQEELYRVDHTFSDRLSVMGRFLNDKIPTQEPGGLFTNANLPGVSQTKTNAPGRTWLGRVTFGITPTLYNEAGYAYSYGALVSQPTGLDNTANSPDVLPNLTLPYKSTLTRIPDLAFADFESVTGFGQYLDFNRNHNVFDNLSWVRGTHALKFGFSFNHYNKNENSAGNSASPANGSFSFDETGTSGLTGACNDDPNCGAYQNWANFLLGSASGFTQQSTDLTADIIEKTYEGYAQDEWRASPRLTVSYGLRYSLFLPPTDGGGILSNFSPSKFVAANAPQLDAKGQLVAGTGNPLNGVILGGKGSPYGGGVNERAYTALGPRIGMAFDPGGNGKTSIRAGYGIFQEALIAGLWEIAVYQNPPYNATTNFNATSLANPASGSAAVNANPPGLVGFADKWRPSYTQQFSLDVQREIGPSLIADVGYYGQAGIHLVGQRDINEVPPGAALAAGIKLPLKPSSSSPVYSVLNKLRPYPGYGAISIFTPSYSSNYNSLQTQITKRFVDGSTLTANYTWAHAMTNNQTAFGTQTFDTYHPERDYGPTQLDRKHVFNGTYVYNLPFLRQSQSVAGRLLGGWEFSGIFAAETGLPLTVFQSSTNGDAAGLGIYDASGLGSTARPNLVGSPNRKAPHTFARWFNVYAFANNTTPGQDGTEPRGSVRGPGFWKFDTALEKSFRITESVAFSFRAAAYNLTNSTSFLGVSTGGFSVKANPATQTGYGSSFGKITTTHDARILQVAGRISF